MPTWSAHSSDDLAVFRERLLMDVHRALWLAFEQRHADGLTRQQLADRLGVTKSVISRRLGGASNLTLGIVSDMARAMGFRPEFHLRAYETLAVGGNARATMTDVHSPSPPIRLRTTASSAAAPEVRHG